MGMGGQGTLPSDYRLVFAIMSIVDRELILWSADTGVCRKASNSPTWRMYESMTALARELEAHCEAMAAALYRLEINADMVDESPELAKWDQFVKERTK